MTLLPPSSPASPWVLPTDYTNGVVFGTNRENNANGPAASGAITVSDGASVTSAYVYAGYEENTTGAITITGANTVWTSASAAVIGVNGTGSFHILDGAKYVQLNPDRAHIGYGPTGVGEVVVRGVDANGNRSIFDIKNGMYVGQFGKGTLRIEDGGHVDAEYTVFVGAEEGSVGNIYIDGVNAQSGHRSTLTTAYLSIYLSIYLCTGKTHVLPWGPCFFVLLLVLVHSFPISRKLLTVRCLPTSCGRY